MDGIGDAWSFSSETPIVKFTNGRLSFSLFYSHFHFVSLLFYSLNIGLGLVMVTSHEMHRTK